MAYAFDPANQPTQDPSKTYYTTVREYIIPAYLHQQFVYRVIFIYKSQPDVIGHEFNTLCELCTQLQIFKINNEKYNDVTNEIDPLLEYIEEAKKCDPYSDEFRTQFNSITQRINNIKFAAERYLKFGGV